MNKLKSKFLSKNSLKFWKKMKMFPMIIAIAMHSPRRCYNDGSSSLWKRILHSWLDSPSIQSPIQILRRNFGLCNSFLSFSPTFLSSNRSNYLAFFLWFLLKFETTYMESSEDDTTQRKLLFEKDQWLDLRVFCMRLSSCPLENAP